MIFTSANRLRLGFLCAGIAVFAAGLFYPAVFGVSQAVAQTEFLKEENPPKTAEEVKQSLLAARSRKEQLKDSGLEPTDFNSMFFTRSDAERLKYHLLLFQTKPKRQPKPKQEKPKEDLVKKIEDLEDKLSKPKSVLNDEIFGPPRNLVNRDSGTDMIIEQLPPVADVTPRDLSLDPDQGMPPLDPFADLPPPEEEKPPPEPGIRELRLGGILFTKEADWIIWLNGMRVTPGAVPEQVIEINVSNQYVELVWYDEYSELMFPIRLRPHERFNLDSRMFLPGTSSRN